MIRIMKASAGSGKTFQLAKTYIRLLLCSEEPHMYRHILAVTFTNKATDEMKRRILKELHVLSTDPASSHYCEDLLPFFKEEKELKQKARRAMCDILHDYGAFAISTIDSFFQQTLRSFSREIGQFPGYQIELETGALVEESVDRVLDSLSEDEPQLLRWLKNSVMEDLNEGRRYNLENSLKDVAKNLKSDEHRAAVEQYGLDEEKEYSREHLKELKKSLVRITETFKKDVSLAAKAFASACGEVGLQPGDFSRNAFDKVFRAASDGYDGVSDVPTPAMLKKCDDYSSWFRKADRERFADYEDRLTSLYRSYCDLFGDRMAVSETARVISSNLVELGIAGELYREFEALLKEKNVLSLDKSNTLLRDIIDGSDAPFVYEKTGVRYENYLLDEFQDTSRIEWENFMPLIKESDSSGRENLLVGDVKQSIYRWRGSDWKMMASEVQEKFAGCIVDTLDSNYRSLRNVVDLNNGFFPFCAQKLDSMLGLNDRLPVSAIYSDSSQKIKTSQEDEGLVEALFCDREKCLAKVLETVRRFIDSGSRPDETAILVRTNNRGSEIAKYLMDNGIGVVSDDSLFVRSSPVVRRVVSLMSSAANPDDTIGSFLAGEVGTDVRNIPAMSLTDLCEHLLRIIKSSDEQAFVSQTQYIQAFMDFVQDYSSLNGNSLSGFLKKWDESDPKIASPADPDCVRIMTIHKSKGLEFRHVIIPFAHETGMFKSDCHWVRPDVKGTELEGVAEGVYHVQLSKPGRDHTLFHGDCINEMYLQFIDNINTFYVALTRAVATLTVIADRPSEDCMKAASAGDGFEFSNFSQILATYLESSCKNLKYSRTDVDGVLEYSKGTLPPHPSAAADGGGSEEAVLPGYPSFPLNPEPGDQDEDVRERGRLKFSADSLEFFLDEADASVSARLNGTVMHSILSKVKVPADLPGAVNDAVLSRDLAQEDAQACAVKLGEAVSKHPEWFPESGSEILAEVPLIDTDGCLYRPDRVLVRDGRVTVIDYKFGEKNRRYARQVRHYADMWSRMGYEVDSAVIWYVNTDEVE